MQRLALVAIVMVSACKRAESSAPPAPASPPPAPSVPVNHVHPHPDAGPVPASRSAYYTSTFSKRPPVAELTALGALAFADPSLSASGKLACATCHDPANAFAPSTATAVQLGGATGKLAGTRAAPSLRYLQAVPRFSEHFHDSDGDDGLDQGPAGGLTWDGRAQSTHDQARSPLFSPLEMANAGPDDLADKLRRATYAQRIRDAFGDDALATTDNAIKALTLVLEVFQQDPARFYPYTSKYDRVLRGVSKLDPAEARGLALFESPAKGNCAVCHPDRVTSGLPAFTDFGYVALGVPRNHELPLTADPSYFDLGLCGPYRTDLADHTAYCGMFRTPSLRNVARRKRYFHNGAFRDLTEVVRFYATRDVAPDRWYPHGSKFDDLPPPYRGNVNMEPPFGGQVGDPPRLDEAEIADVVAFLETLSDADP